MSPRRTRSDQLEIPARLIELATLERTSFKPEVILARLTSSGVIRLTILGDDSMQPLGIAYERVDSSGWIEILYVRQDPVASALEELGEYLPKFDQLARLHSAMIDMDLITSAARALAAEREAGDTWPFGVAHVLEAGIFAMYARSYTGNASVGGRWRPVDQADRLLHDEIIDARNSTHVHADRNESRVLLDTNALAQAANPELGNQTLAPAFGEVRTPVPTPKLIAIAELCERQYARLYEATYYLKVELGMLPAPSERTPGDVR